MENVTFVGSRGVELAGILDQPEDDATTYAIIAHCFTCNKSYPAVARVAKALKDMGIGVLRFDFAGLGQSAGNFTESTFSADVDDLVAASEWMQSRGHTVELLIGHSLGGAAVLAAAGRIPTIKAVATIAAPSDPGFVAKQLADQIKDIGEEGVVETIVAGHTVLIGAPLIDDLQSQSSHIQRIQNLPAPLLVMHSPDDTVVDIRHANAIYRHAPMPKSFIALDGADHLLTRAAAGRWVARMIAAWASAYVGTQ